MCGGGKKQEGCRADYVVSCLPEVRVRALLSRSHPAFKLSLSILISIRIYVVLGYTVVKEHVKWVSEPRTCPLVLQLWLADWLLANNPNKPQVDEPSDSS